MKRLLISLICFLFFPHSVFGASFIRGAWVAHWSDSKRIETVADKLESFNEVSPLIYELGNDGTILRMVSLTSGPWSDLLSSLSDRGTTIIPTILAGDKELIHSMLSDEQVRGAHIEALRNLVVSNKYAGIDIDYEGKYFNDKNLFSIFISDLAKVLHGEGKMLSCTIEPRTTDSPHAHVPEKTLFIWANDYNVLGNKCDVVRIMVYDHYFLTRGAHSWTQPIKNFGGLHADNEWTKSVLQYALRYIPKEKIILGVPTYGYEFTYKDTVRGRNFTRSNTLSYEKALSIQKMYGAKLQRLTKGEQYFTYKKAGVKKVVILADAKSSEKKIQLAKTLGIKGVYFFKVEGTEDPLLYATLLKY